MNDAVKNFGDIPKNTSNQVIAISVKEEIYNVVPMVGLLVVTLLIYITSRMLYNQALRV